MPIVAIARATAAAICVPLTPHRVEAEPSATTTTLALLGCSNSRTISGVKFVSVDWAQSICEGRSPPASRAAHEVESGAVRHGCGGRPSSPRASGGESVSSISLMSDRLTSGLSSSWCGALCFSE
jgi:hypothetical protein